MFSNALETHIFLFPFFLVLSFSPHLRMVSINVSGTNKNPHCFLIPHWSWEPQYSIPLHSDMFVSNTRFYMYTYYDTIYSFTCLWKFLSSARKKCFPDFLYIHLLAQNLAQSCWLHGFIKPKIESEAIKCTSAY